MQDQAVFKAIADPTRRAIISMLAGKDLTVNQIAAEFEMSRPAVAKHLGILEEGEIISVRREGRERYNHLQPERLKVALDWLNYFSQYWDDKLAKLKEEVEREND